LYPREIIVIRGGAQVDHVSQKGYNISVPFQIYVIYFIIFKSSLMSFCLCKEEFVDTKGAIRIRISRKNRQHNGQKKKYKRTNNDQQNISINLMIE